MSNIQIRSLHQGIANCPKWTRHSSFSKDGVARQLRDLKESEILNDWLVVVLLDDTRVSISRASDRLWLGLPWLGTTIPKVYPAPSRASSSR